ncbi:hypothetical protein BU52_27400 [Streptomyces toyocaensis]|uniref:Uncharacterized protein n=1 Tax=Streptomyces toyocaensis TaxID=55952 RepID=A0A081XKD5_STRTO|nr:hypothetical protein [Streptomyces toyocaensis]KES04008.1 hypothetical protein BU52_27400 [Streptomyces toyocaensis]
MTRSPWTGRRCAPAPPRVTVAVGPADPGTPLTALPTPVLRVGDGGRSGTDWTQLFGGRRPSACAGRT